MALLIGARGLKKSFGAQTLFSEIAFSVSDGDRITLIGPNGAGKSTLLKILAGQEEPDTGEVALRKLAKMAYVAQESVFAPGATVGAAVGAQDDPRRQMLLSQAGFEDLAAPVDALSGGWKKRLAIVEGMAAEPELLLLDEPTNHLDLAGILWLEKTLKAARFASVVITHDRYFMENVSTHVAELAPVYPSGLFVTEGGYADFLEKREAWMEAQTKLEESLANKVRREVEWLRRGPKARTTKSKARIDAAHELMGALADVQTRQRTSSVQIDFTASDRQTKKLLVAEGLGKSLGGRRLFEKLDVTLTPGMRLGLAGANGSGKTTLLRVLGGELEADAGEVRRADNLRVVYFAQDRMEQLDGGVSLKRALCPHGDSVIFRDRPLHVNAWARRFSFRPEQLEQPVARLSGGERARVQIARLMLEPADLLMLDEPTNDLDIPTLETLEENLLDFPGALVLVTHDRYMMDRVSTHVLGLDGDGTARVYADYSQWEAAQAAPSRASESVKAPKADPPPAPAAKKKLSYLEQREFDGMEARVLEAEETMARLKGLMEDPAVMADAPKLARTYEDLQTAERSVAELYERWAELEAKAG